jgi:hypothetical protein
MDAATTVEVVSGVSEVVVALGALIFALLLARHESASRDRVDEKLEEILRILVARGSNHAK